MRIAFGLTTTVTVLIVSTLRSWAQGRDATGPTSPASGAGSTASTVLALGVLAAILIAIVILARYAAARRKLNEEAVILQSQLSDIVARESQLRGLAITPQARVSGWRRAEVTIEVAGDVPTPEIRETVMRIVGGEARRLRPDVITLDHLFIVPPKEGALSTSGAPERVPR